MTPTNTTTECDLFFSYLVLVLIFFFPFLDFFRVFLPLSQGFKSETRQDRLNKIIICKEKMTRLSVAMIRHTVPLTTNVVDYSSVVW